jgi:hypothetical protein
MDVLNKSALISPRIIDAITRYVRAAEIADTIDHYFIKASRLAEQMERLTDLDFSELWCSCYPYTNQVLWNGFIHLLEDEYECSSVYYSPFSEKVFSLILNSNDPDDYCDFTEELAKKVVALYEDEVSKNKRQQNGV